jgi:hypothetical protein
MMPLFNLMLIFQVPLVADSSAIDPKTGLSNIPTFLGDLFPTLVKVIAAIAVLTIAYWGIRYMLSNVAGTKGVSKDRIWSTLLGLLLALSAYLILEIINPDIIGSLSNFVGSKK